MINAFSGFRAFFYFCVVGISIESKDERVFSCNLNNHQRTGTGFLASTPIHNNLSSSTNLCELFIPDWGLSITFLYIFNLTCFPICFRLSLIPLPKHLFRQARWRIRRRLLWRIGRWARSGVRMWRIFRWSRFFWLRGGDATICERKGRSVGDNNLKFYVVVAGLLDGFMLNVGSSQPSYIGSINLWE